MDYFICKLICFYSLIVSKQMIKSITNDKVIHRFPYNFVFLYLRLLKYSISGKILIFTCTPKIYFNGTIAFL